MKKSKRPTVSLEINAGDTVTASDKISTYKPWFNGLKHFYTVKTLPPRK